MVVRGGLNLWGATIRAGLELDDATLVAEDRLALRAPKLTVAGDVTLGDSATVSGGIDLSSASVGGCLSLTYRVVEEHVLSLSEVRVNSLQLGILPAKYVSVDLNGATIVSFVDTQTSWPRVLKLDRMKYETLRPLLPARERLLWDTSTMHGRSCSPNTVIEPGDSASRSGCGATSRTSQSDTDIDQFAH